MTDIPSLIEEADKVLAVPASVMGGTSFIIPIGLFKRMRDALSLTVSPLPEEIAELIVWLNDCIGGKPASKAAAALERMGREIERLKGIEDDYLRRHKDACDRLERIRELESERDNLDTEWHRVIHERDEVRAKTIEECAHIADKYATGATNAAFSTRAQLAEIIRDGIRALK